jgi:prepilin-type N-terminal cleavage/methylation domain-containing protein
MNASRHEAAATTGGRERGRSGVTIVEVMIAMIVLAIMAIGGAAFLFHSRATISAQGRKRQALEISNARLERIRATPVNVITNALRADNFTLHYLSEDGAGGWNVGVVPNTETVTVDGHAYSLETTAVYRDLDGGPASYDYLEIAAKTTHGRAPQDFVQLKTYYMPEQRYYSR